MVDKNFVARLLVVRSQIVIVEGREDLNVFAVMFQQYFGQLRLKLFLREKSKSWKETHPTSLAFAHKPWLYGGHQTLSHVRSQ